MAHRRTNDPVEIEKAVRTERALAPFRDMPPGSEGSIPCPVCKVGTLSWRRVGEARGASSLIRRKCWNRDCANFDDFDFDDGFDPETLPKPTVWVSTDVPTENN